MITITEFSKLTKPKMVVSLIEAMVFQCWDISNFVYGFRAYKKDELIKQYIMHLDYEKRQK